MPFATLSSETPLCANAPVNKPLNLDSVHLPRPFANAPGSIVTTISSPTKVGKRSPKDSLNFAMSHLTLGVAINLRSCASD